MRINYDELNQKGLYYHLNTEINLLINYYIYNVYIFFFFYLK